MPLNWQTVSPLEQLAADGFALQPSETTSGADPTTPAPSSAQSANLAAQSPWIIGIGGGARIGSGEPTYPMVYGRLGRKLDSNVGLSMRPRYIFGNSDLQGQSNSEGAFQLPFTLDFRPTSWLSPYLGGGIATNTDTTGKTDGMVSLGADLSIGRNLAIDLGVNYIFQSSSVDSTSGDLEFTTVLYLRF
jgi:opacity protein-like surface antigen